MKVAVKLILIEGESQINLLETEFKIAESLTDKNIVHTYFSNKVNIDGSLYLYVAMEYVDGGSLENFLRRASQPIPINQALDIMMQTAQGLAAAHEQIVHRDLKPDNILLTLNGTVKFCDFGISKFVSEATRTRTFKGWGTLPYMAPECWSLDKNTPAMDVYALGIIYYRILTGKLPFNGPSDSDYMNQHLYDPFPNLALIRPDLDIKLVQIVSKMTQKSYQSRYANGREVLNVIQNLSINNSIPAINPLLQKANAKLYQKTQEELVRQKQEQDALQKFNIVKFSINVLFDKFINEVNLINSNLESGKIHFKRNELTLTIQFLNRKINIRFFQYNSVDNFIGDYRKRIISDQMERWGMVMSSSNELYLSKDKVDQVGILEVQPSTVSSAGANLLLLHNDETDIYGDWFCCWFDDSGLSNKYRKHYPMEGEQFFKEYEYGRGRVMHVTNMTFKYLDEDVIRELIDPLFE